MHASAFHERGKRSWVSVAVALLGLAFFTINAGALPFYYWDANGNQGGAGSTPTGTWGVDAFWTSNVDGTIDTFRYDQRANVAFSAVDAVNAYTVTVSGTQQVGDIHFDDGAVTLQGGYLDKDSPLISVIDAAHTAIINSAIISKAGTANGITKYKLGTLILGGANTYLGPTTIEGGTLRLAAAQRIPSGSDLVLVNGDTRLPQDGFTDTPPTFDTGGYSQTLGVLHLTNIAANAFVPRTIDFGNGASALVFADSHGQDWQGLPLTIRNFTLGVDSFRFGTSSSGLTTTQLGLFQFADFGNAAGKINASGFVTPDLPAPVVQSITKEGGTATIVWSAVPNGVYCVQYRGSLSAGSWTSLPNVTASADTASYPDSSATPGQRFYRVAVVY